MTHDRRSGDNEVVDLRPPGHWGRHPMTRVVMFTALGLVLAGRFVVDGDAGLALLASSMGVLMAGSIAAAVGQMRGNVSALPGRTWQLVSPIAGIVWSAAMLLACILLLLDMWLTTGERSVWFIRGMFVGAGLLAVGLWIQIFSLSDQWPDKWRPPYARGVTPTSATDEPDAHANAEGHDVAGADPSDNRGRPR